MLNRRKHSHGDGSSFEDDRDNRLHHDANGQGDDERQQLLLNSPRETAVSSHRAAVPPTRRGIDKQSSATYHIEAATDTLQGESSPAYSRPIPTYRKARDKSPDQLRTDNPAWNINVTRHHYSNTTVHDTIPSTSSIHVRPDFGDHYELNQIGSNPNSSRAIIDFSHSSGREFPPHSKRQQQTDFIFYTIQPDDTLQNLSVKYSCPVASIKRLNNLWSDQEFYGLSRIKLPVGKLRLIADVIEERDNSNPASDSKQSLNKSSVQSTHGLTNQSPDTTIINSANVNNKTSLGYLYGQPIQSHQVCLLDQDRSLLEELNRNVRDEQAEKSSNESIFKNLDLNIERARAAAKSYDDNASAIMQQLAQNGNIVEEETEEELSEACLRARREAETLLNDLSDYGLSYNFLILFIFIVCLVCPLAYVIYLEETHHESNKAHGVLSP